MRLRLAVALVTVSTSMALSVSSAVAEEGQPGMAWQAYARAIADAAVSRPGEVVQDLVVADPGDARTEWATIDGEPHMLVSRLGYRPLSAVSPGEAFTVPSAVFVVLPGEVRAACEEYGCAKMTTAEPDLQLKQLLGLPPDADYGVVSRVWVRPVDLFRPCTQVDPLIPTCPQLVVNTTQAGVDRSSFLISQGMYAWRTQRRGTTTPISCAQDFQNTMRGNCFGFPWTRLGYTYDWTPGARDDRGLTEFVIAPGSRVVLESTGTQRQYYPYEGMRGGTA